jgi:pimeloyl-ACP methyl ester carboxylesterase
MTMPPEPTDRFYQSQGVRLHVTDWGNEAAPLLILLHGGRDHSRSWDRVARALQPHFHVIAPDLRGHGDSEWAKGSSYSLSDHVYDLTPLVGPGRETIMVGHSFGGMISLAYAGTFPDRVSRLAILDGVFLSGRSSPIEERIAKWIGQLNRVSQSTIRRFRDVAEAAERMAAHNKRLSAEQALHLARHAVRPNADGSFSWKYDPYQRVEAPYRLSHDDYTALWSRISCPVLLLSASESFLPDAGKAGLLKHFKQVEHRIIAGTGHWLHHDAPEEVLATLRAFLDARD